MDKMKICIYSLGAYHLLADAKTDYIGGAELQASLLGKEFSKQKDVEVSFAVFDNGQPDHEIINGIHVYKTKPRMYLVENRGFAPLLKTMVLNWKVLKTINSDVYYARGSGKYTGIIALFCLLHRKKFVLGMASDKDIDGSFEKKSRSYERLSYLFAIRFASEIISQNSFQKGVLKNRFRKNSVQINNANHVPSGDIVKKNPPVVLWVGTIRHVWKQPEIFLKLAEELPDVHFQMVGGPATDSESIELYEQIKIKAEKMPNFELVGFVSQSKIERYYNDASILVNTSSVEGFPNTFIEAWMRYVPVVSLNIDPDDILTRNKLGFKSESFSQLVKDVKLLLDDDKLRGELGNNARLYAEKEFDIKVITQKYIRLFAK